MKDKLNTVIYVCLICGTPTGETQDWRQSDLDPVAAFGTDDPNQWRQRKGVCAKCTKLREEGHVLMYSDTRGVILAPAAAAKLKPEFRDKILKIPEEEMSKVWPTEKPSTETEN
jgi:hypothetical protein